MADTQKELAAVKQEQRMVEANARFVEESETASVVNIVLFVVFGLVVVGGVVTLFYGLSESAAYLPIGLAEIVAGLMGILLVDMFWNVSIIAKTQKELLKLARGERAGEWRTWTDLKGEGMEARFGGMAMGKATLIDRHGSAIRVAPENLSAEDQEWIKGEKWKQ
ncbi:MAG: SHD1 domain-containing protein [Thermoguttaceae bacterium]|jgi:hypothetical protein